MVSDQNGGGCTNPNYTYDVANRLVSAKVSGSTEYYLYNADNKRIATIGSNGSQTIVIYGAMGKKLSVGSFSKWTNNVYFAGRLIRVTGTEGLLLIT